MAYIRIKKINNTQYGYLVETKATSNGPRQKVKQYLGRVFEFEKASEVVKESSVAKTKKEFLQSLVSRTLVAHGFRETKNSHKNEQITFSHKNLSITKKNGKEIVVRSGDGHLCKFTLSRLMRFKKSNDLDQDAYKLAKYFLDAGLEVSEEEFVKYYELL